MPALVYFQSIVIWKISLRIHCHCIWQVALCKWLMKSFNSELLTRPARCCCGNQLGSENFNSASRSQPALIIIIIFSSSVTYTTAVWASSASSALRNNSKVYAFPSPSGKEQVDSASKHKAATVGTSHNPLTGTTGLWLLSWLAFCKLVQERNRQRQWGKVPETRWNRVGEGQASEKIGWDCGPWQPNRKEHLQ